MKIKSTKVDRKNKQARKKTTQARADNEKPRKINGKTDKEASNQGNRRTM